MINTFEDIVVAVDSIADTIPQIANDTNFWMIRSKQGVFYNEFIDGNYIAIGWNALSQKRLEEGHNDDYYKQVLKDESYPDKVPGTAVNKCRRFIDEIKTGDIAMIVGRTEITFATIGEYFEVDTERTTVQKELEVHKQIENGTYWGLNCPYSKRRYISIISKVDLESAPPMVYKCLVSNRHSLSSLNDYADALLSCCYDLAYYSGKLILKYHVRQPRDINPLDFSLFTYSIASLVSNSCSNITGKYNLNSEGDVVLFLSNHAQEAVSFIKDALIPIMIGYFILFGGKVAGIEFPSSIDKIKGLVSEYLHRQETQRIRAAEADMAEANVSKTRAETEKLQAETEKIRVETEQLRASSKTQEANSIVDNLLRAAGPLNIRPPANNIIDISAFFHEDNEPD